MTGNVSPRRVNTAETPKNLLETVQEHRPKRHRVVPKIFPREFVQSKIQSDLALLLYFIEGGYLWCQYRLTVADVVHDCRDAAARYLYATSTGTCVVTVFISNTYISPLKKDYNKGI